MKDRRITEQLGKSMGLSRRTFLQTAAALPFASTPTLALEREFRHGLTVFEALKYPKDFPHFAYVNPQAPKGGRIRLGRLGSFDSLNPFTLKGDPLDPLVNEPLMVQSLDEPATDYCLLAEGVWHPEDLSTVVFRLRPEARFQDGEPVKPSDVIYSLDVQRANLPNVEAYYKDISKAEQTGDHEVTFIFKVKGNRELPKITGQLRVLPKHWWEGKDASGKQRDISAASLEGPLGSGPYKVGKVVPGQTFTMERVKDYWGEKLPVNVGQNNFDEVEYQLYKDQTILIEAFKGDQYDVQLETSAKTWATGYDFPAVRNGSVIKEEVKREGVSGMQAWAPNLRREKFRDARVRRALNLAFDFEWSRENLFYNQYTRSRSFFNNSEFEAKGLPSPEELAILEPLKDKLPPEVFTAEFSNPMNTSTQERRKNLREAQALLAEAGWTAAAQGDVRVLKNAKGETFKLEFLLYAPTFERIALPYKEQLNLLGFDVSVRTVDLSQYERRTQEFDYDIIVDSWPQSLSPGNEQREYWTTEFAGKPGSQNSVGIMDPAIDSLVETLIRAPDRKALITACRALDRALIWNHFVVPMFFVPTHRLAYWKRVTHVKPMPGYFVGYPDQKTWWFDKEAAATISKT